jgi:hypothetical protein
MGKFVIRKSSNSQYYFNLKADNGEIILTSEMYIAKSSCENGISSVKTNSPYNGNYEKLVSVNGKNYFNLKASNGQVIGTSQMYESAQGRDNGIESVKNNAPLASTNDESKTKRLPNG